MKKVNFSQLDDDLYGEKRFFLRIQHLKSLWSNVLYFENFDSKTKLIDDFYKENIHTISSNDLYIRNTNLKSKLKRLESFQHPLVIILRLIMTAVIIPIITSTVLTLYEIPESEKTSVTVLDLWCAIKIVYGANKFIFGILVVIGIIIPICYLCIYLIYVLYLKGDIRKMDILSYELDLSEKYLRSRLEEAKNNSKLEGSPAFLKLENGEHIFCYELKEIQEKIKTNKK